MDTPWRSLNFRAALLSVLILLVLLGIWYAATGSTSAATSSAGMSPEQIEYAEDDGQGPGRCQGLGFPTLGQMGQTVWGQQLSNPFYDNGPNDKGIAIQLAHSLGRVALGFRAGLPGGDSARLCDRHVAAAAPCV
jgi:nitrate/nitrite transport system permease protein